MFIELYRDKHVKYTLCHAIPMMLHSTKVDVVYTYASIITLSDRTYDARKTTIM